MSMPLEWLIYTPSGAIRRGVSGPAVREPGQTIYRVEASAYDRHGNQDEWYFSVELPDRATAERLFRLTCGRYPAVELDCIKVNEKGGGWGSRIYESHSLPEDIRDYMRRTAPAVCQGSGQLALAPSILARRAQLAAMQAKAGERGNRRRSTTGRRSVTPSQRARVLERDGFACRRCGTNPTHARMVVDHIIPVALGGKSHDGNLQTLCEPCNQGKADREPVAHDLLTYEPD